MKKLRTVMAVFLCGAIVALAAGAVSESAYAVDVFQACQGQNDPVCGARGETVRPLLVNIINTLLLLVGIVAVIFIIVGGYRYIIANGDASKITSAKNTIMYAAIGLVIALSAYAIVAFVISSI